MVFDQIAELRPFYDALRHNDQLIGTGKQAQAVGVTRRREMKSPKALTFTTCIECRGPLKKQSPWILSATPICALRR
jgi:hypothetical protein